MINVCCRLHEMPVHPAVRVTASYLLTKIIAITCVCGAAGAAETQSVILETVVVTSPPLALGAEAFSMTHLSGDELATASRLDVALGQVPGLSLFRRDSSLSANPTTQGMSLRSIAPSGAGRALVTLDGVPLNDPFGNWVIWSGLPTEAIAEADVVRGAGAGPYGSGSLTGVVTLTERSDVGLSVVNAEAGELGQRRIAAAGGADLGGVTLFGSASAQHSDGWIPVARTQRGAADNEVTLSATNASLRGEFHPADGTAVAVRVAAYNEHRDSGLVGASSSAKGLLLSVTAAHPEQEGELGWRLQTWWRDTDFTNVSVTVGGGRATTTPSNEQYATPAIGWGANAALRGQLAWLNWELGTDVRYASGESREFFTFVSGAFTQERIAGGKSLISGVYLETAARTQQWLATLGIRADQWRSSDGHLVQRARANGAVSLEQYPESQSGTVPTARAGIRREFSGGTYLRTAAYSGFRTPSLNELYRPFRLGNNITQANAALRPERLYGVELGAGGAVGDWSWDLTVFRNRLRHAITNVTIGQGPGTFPGAGFVPAGGLLIQRQNAGDIDALGIEAEMRWQITEWYSLRTALAVVDAEVDGGAQAPQLTGKRPGQAPRSTVTAGLVMNPFAQWTGTINYRHESARYADDLNTLPLGSAPAVDMCITWTPSQRFGIYAAVSNLLDADIATTQTADKVVSYAAPRTFVIGVRVGQ